MSILLRVRPSAFSLKTPLTAPQAVLSDIKAVAETIKRTSPETLVIVDGVCSVASEEIRFDDWGLDVVLTASQKGLGTPPGLSILVASTRAIKVCGISYP